MRIRHFFVLNNLIGPPQATWGQPPPAVQRTKLRQPLSQSGIRPIQPRGKTLKRAPSFRVLCERVGAGTLSQAAGGRILIGGKCQSLMSMTADTHPFAENAKGWGTLALSCAQDFHTLPKSWTTPPSDQSLSPRWGSILFSTPTHGLRRGLYSGAASRLRNMHFVLS